MVNLACGKPGAYRPYEPVEMTFADVERNAKAADVVPPPAPAKRKVGRPRKTAV